MNISQLIQVKHSGWYFCSPATCLYMETVRWSTKHKRRDSYWLLQDDICWGPTLGTSLNPIFWCILALRLWSVGGIQRISSHWGKKQAFSFILVGNRKALNVWINSTSLDSVFLLAVFDSGGIIPISPCYLYDHESVWTNGGFEWSIWQLFLN